MVVECIENTENHVCIDFTLGKLYNKNIEASKSIFGLMTSIIIVLLYDYTKGDMGMKKKKHQKYIQFVNRIKSDNYRNKKIIVDKFNSSVKAYKRFEDLFNAGDEECASEYLQDAGMALYVSYEWALKNYLDRRYAEQYRNGNISKQTCKNKMEGLQWKNLKYLLQEAKSLCIPSLDSIGIDEKRIVEGAKDVNNKIKHEANTPSPQKYKVALNEIRKFMKSYLDSNAKYEVLEESLYGDEKGWYEILEVVLCQDLVPLK